MALNVKAVFCLIQRLLPLLRKAASQGRSSRVINIGSASGIVMSGNLRAFSGSAVYLASDASAYMTGNIISVDGGIAGCA